MVSLGNKKKRRKGWTERVQRVFHALPFQTPRTPTASPLTADTRSIRIAEYMGLWVFKNGDVDEEKNYGREWLSAGCPVERVAAVKCVPAGSGVFLLSIVWSIYRVTPDRQYRAGCYWRVQNLIIMLRNRLGLPYARKIQNNRVISTIS